MSCIYNLKPIEKSRVFPKKIIFIATKENFPLSFKYFKKYKKLQNELEEIDNPLVYILVRLFLSNQEVEFKPDALVLLKLLRSSVLIIRQNALLCFDHYYSERDETLLDKTIWLSGSVEGYKLKDIRTLLQEFGTKVLTRESNKVNLLVVGLKAKVEILPNEDNLKIISSLALQEQLNLLEEQRAYEEMHKPDSSLLVDGLLTDKTDLLRKKLEELNNQGVSAELAPLVLAIYKVHSDKSIRTQAKELLERESSKMIKEVLLFCSRKNYINAKYSVGMEEMEKIKGFHIDLFLYYLVLEQKHHLGKEYLARLDSDWTQKLIEERELFNQKKVTLYGEAGKRFIYAKKIEEFIVHSSSLVVWEMMWLKQLTIIDNKKEIELPVVSSFIALDSLTLESKEVFLQGSWRIQSLELQHCKKLNIAERFELPDIESLIFSDCSFSLEILKNFLEKATFPKIKSIKFNNFLAYKMPKNWEEELTNIFGKININIT